MSVVNLVLVEALERTPCVFLRQITGLDGELLTKDDIEWISYDVWIVPMTRQRYQDLFGVVGLAGAGSLPLSTIVLPYELFNSVSLDPQVVMYDTPQIEPRWTKDSIGYNFAATMGAEMFPAIGIDLWPTPEWQEFWFTFKPVGGEAFQSCFIVQKKHSLGGPYRGTGTATGTGTSP